MCTYCLQVFMCREVCWEGADEGVKMWQGVSVGGQNAFPPTLLECVG